MGGCVSKKATDAPASDGTASAQMNPVASEQSTLLVTGKTPRSLSLPKQVAAAGGVRKWNERDPDSVALWRMLDAMVKSTKTVDDALNNVRGLRNVDRRPRNN
jgi:hypothetical protein